MTEVRIYAALVLALMVGAYLSWTQEDAVEKGTKVTLLAGSPDELGTITFYARDSTVTLSRRELGGETFDWFDVDSSRDKRFTGNEKVEKLRAGFAPFEALRALGRNLTEEELKLTGLDTVNQRLVIELGGKRRTFEVGKRTAGARDHYVRPEGSEEIYLVAAATLSDLHYPAGKYMQRKLRASEKTSVAKVVVAMGDKTKTALQLNRLSPKDAFWADESAPETPNKDLGKYMDKLERLSAQEYVPESATEGAVPVMDVIWYGGQDEELGRMALSRVGEGKGATYLAVTPTTRVAAKVSNFNAEQLEREFPDLLAE